MLKKPAVNQDDCISCGLCVISCPAVFRFDSSGKSECHDPAGTTEEQIQQAINSCPVQCISWQTT